MKLKALFLVVTILTGSAVFAQQKKAAPKAPAKPAQQKSAATKAPAQKGTLFFDKTSYNFGRIDEDMGMKYVNFDFTNIGKGDVRILDVITGCGCTHGDWNRDRVYKQGEKDHITISYNPKNINGTFARTVTVQTDGDPALTYLNLEGDVYGPTRDLNEQLPYTIGETRLSHNVVNFPKVHPGKNDSMNIRIFNNTNKWMRVLTVLSPPYVRVRTHTPYMEPKSYCTFTVTLFTDSIKMWGPVEDKIRIVTNETEQASKEIVFKTYVEEDFSKMTPKERKSPPQAMFTETVKDLGEVYIGEVVDYDFEVTNTGKSDLYLRRAYGSCGCTVAKVSTEPIKKGKKGKVSVRFDAKSMFGPQTKSITVITNDPAHPVTVLTIKALLVEDGAKK